MVWLDLTCTILLLIKLYRNAGISWLSQKTCLLFTSIYNHKFLIFNLANLAIANINHCLCLGLTKTDYKMSFNSAVHSTHVQSPSTKKFEMCETSWLRDTWYGCENLSTAYEFSTRDSGQVQASSGKFRHVQLNWFLPKNESCH